MFSGSRTDKAIVESAYSQAHEYMRQYFGIGTGEHTSASEPSRSRVVPVVMAVPYARCNDRTGNHPTEARSGTA